MEGTVEEYVQAVAHMCVERAVWHADFRVALKVVYGEEIEARVEVVPVEDNRDQQPRSNRKRKSREYREMLQAKEEEINRLKEELRKAQSPGLPPLSRVSTPSSDKTYRVNFSRQTSPLDQSSGPRTVFSRKSSWERTTQTEDRQPRHVNTPSLVDANVQVEEIKPKKPKKVLKIEDDSSEDEGKETCVGQSLPPSSGITETDFGTTGRFQKVEICTQTDLTEEQKPTTVEIALSQSSSPKKEATSPHAEHANVVVNISVTTAPPLLNKLRRLEKAKRPKRKRPSPPPEKHPPVARPSPSYEKPTPVPRPSPPHEKPPPVSRPHSEAPRSRPKPIFSRPLHTTKISVSSKSSKGESEAQHRSLRSTMPSSSEPEDPAVRQNLMKYLKTHQFQTVRPATVQNFRRQSMPKARKLKPAPRPPTPLSELLYSGLYSDQDSWQNVVQVFRDNPSLLSKFISPPVIDETLPSIQSPQPSERSASARLSLISRTGRRYRVMESTPVSDVTSPRPQTRESRANPTPSPAIRHPSRTQEKPVKDWSLSPLDEEVGNGHYNFNWQKDPSLLLKSEIVSYVKLLEDCREGQQLPEIHHKAVRTLRKLQADLMLIEPGTHVFTTVTVPGVLALLHECLRLLKMRQMTISVLHYLHQREEALLNVLSDSAEGGEAVVQQLSRLLGQALSTWRLGFPAAREFLYLGRDYLEEDYLNGQIQAEDLRH